MKTADVFNVQNNIVLAFMSGKKNYKMHLLIEDELIRLEEVKDGNTVNEKIIFLGEDRPYTGEPVKVTEEKLLPKPKKKRNKKKK